jgi:hypothetical protein
MNHTDNIDISYEVDEFLKDLDEIVQELKDMFTEDVSEDLNQFVEVINNLQV